MHNISEEEYGSLRAILDHPGFKVLLKELENLAEGQFQEMKRDHTNNYDANRFWMLKAKYEGAEKLVHDFQRRAEVVLKSG